MLPVGVYVGTALYAAPPRPDIVTGGHGKDDDEAAGIGPAPAPPVCQAEYVPAQGSCAAAPKAWHLPEAVRGSFGTHPFARPYL